MTNVGVMARSGLFLLRDGRWQNQQILAPGHVAEARRPRPVVTDATFRSEARFAGATRHYGLLFWNNADGAMKGVPTDALWGWESTTASFLVVPSLDLVVSRSGPVWQGSSLIYDRLQPFFALVAAAAKSS